MSGFVGVWNLDGAPVDAALLAHLADAMHCGGADAQGAWSDGSIGMAVRLARCAPESVEEVQPAQHLAGPVLALDGRLDNRSDLLARLGGDADALRGAPDAAVVLALYAGVGEAFCDHLVGDFALALYDPSVRTLTLARDTFGVRPLYYWTSPTGVIFATQIKALLAHPDVVCRPNNDHVIEYLLDVPGPDDGGRTYFEGVKAVPPSSVTVFNGRSVTFRRYWDFDTQAQVRLARVEEYAEAHRALFEGAVARRLRSPAPVAVSVSGGIDSSSILCMAHQLAEGDGGSVASAFGLSFATADGSLADEERYLCAIERQYGEAIERLPVSLQDFYTSLEHAAAATESPVLDFKWAVTMRLMSRARERGACTWLSGNWGDEFLFDWSYLGDLLARGRLPTAWRHVRQYEAWHTDAPRGTLTRAIARHAVGALLRRCLPETVSSARVRRGLHRSAPTWYNCLVLERAVALAHGGTSPVAAATAHTRSLYAEARSRRKLALMEWVQKASVSVGLDVAFPFLDRDLVAWQMAIPGEVQALGGVPRGLHRRAMAGILPEEIRFRTSKGDVTHWLNAGLASRRSLLSEMLGAESMVVRWGYADPKVLAAEVLRQVDVAGRSPNAIAGWHLGRVLGLEAWLRAFMARETAKRRTAEDDRYSRDRQHRA